MGFDYKNFNKLIKIKSSEKSISEIAKDLGITRQTLHNWRTGKITPSLKKIEKIADYFKISIKDLLN